MKRISCLFTLILSLSGGLLFSQPIIDCVDLVDDFSSAESPGIYGVSDVSLDYNGSNQIVTLGIYGFYSNQQEDQTFFSVNGSAPVSLETLGWSYTLGGVQIVRDQSQAWIDLENVYLSGASNSFNGRVYKFIGAVDNITMTQFESGVVYSCVEQLDDTSDCYYDFPGDEGNGYIVDSTYPFSFDGSDQTVEVGYFDYVWWGQQSSQWEGDRTYFSVNGSDMIMLDDIYYSPSTYVNGVSIYIDTTSIADEYLPQEGMISGRIVFIGEIDLIVTQQVESGIGFICTSPNVEQGDCQDFTYELDDPYAPGIYSLDGVPLEYDGQEQQVSLGIYGTFNEWLVADLWQAGETFFSVNGSDGVSLEEIYLNMPMQIGDVLVAVDTNSLVDTYGLTDEQGWTSGTILFTGAIEEIVMTQFESGLVFSCVSSVENEDCIDHSEGGTILIGGGYELVFDGTNQAVSIGIGTYFHWGELLGAGLGYVGDFTQLSVNGNSEVTLTDIYFNQPLQVGEVTITLDTVPLTAPYDIQNSNTYTGTILITGEIEQVDLFLSEGALLFSCTEPSYLLPEDCTDYTEDGVPPLGGTADIAFDGTNQTVNIGILGSFNWDDLGGWGSAGDCYLVTVNGINESLSLTYIYENQPLQLEGITYSLDTLSLNDQYELPWPTAITGTLIISGEINQVELLQCEAATLFSCTDANQAIDEDCTDFTFEGVPQMDQTPSVIFDGTHLDVSIGFWGYFDWDDDEESLAEYCYFSLNNGPQISFDSLYNYLPMTYEGLEVSLDTTSMNAEYGIADYLGSSTLLISGELELVEFSFIEVAGLLFSCKAEVDPEDCECDIDADFSYINLGSYYSFVSSGTGSEYLWDFGNGSTSEAESPSHYYETPGTYEVCMTNYNLTDTCSITICQSVEVTLETPGANIITPNGDGQDDFQELNCNDVTIYNRNGRVVARLQNQQYWDGRDSRGVLLPMGEYVLRCNENQVISKVTTIW